MTAISQLFTGIRLIFAKKVIPNFQKNNYNKNSLLKITAASFSISACKMSFQEDKEQFLKMPVEEKRKHYVCKNYVTLDKVLTWQQFYTENKDDISKPKEPTEYDAVSEELNKKVSIWFGDITSLEIDAVVNAANNALCGGSGVDGAIHKGAGPTLLKECRSLKGCPTGEVKLAGGYQLPAKYVILTVGPMNKEASMLKSCYEKSLDLALENNFKTIAFPCISTGVYGYPRVEAANIAIATARKFLEKNASKVDRIIFCLFLDEDKDVYKQLMQKYFPVSTTE